MNKIIEEKIKQTLNSYIGEYESFIDDILPLWELLMVCIQTGTMKDSQNVAKAISYFMAPLDIMDEKTYGPYAFVPHIYVARKALQMDVGPKFVKRENKCFEILTKEDIERINEYLGWE